MFKSLFGKSSPTRRWSRQHEYSLKFDLDDCSLNHCRLGQRLESLSFLGPDEDRKSFPLGEFRYYSLGLCVECNVPENNIFAFHLIYRDRDNQAYKPFSGDVIYKGDTIDLFTMTLDTCVSTLGDYYWIDRDDDETIVFYEFEGLEWQCEFNAASLLKRLTATNQPVMADEKLRHAYNVTKPWPQKD